jgi:invasion protein IalB
MVARKFNTPAFMRRLVCSGFISLGIFAMANVALFVRQPSAAMAQETRRPDGQSSGADAPRQSTGTPSAEPLETTATYGDWVLRCDRVQRQNSTMRICEVAAGIVIGGQQIPIVEVGIGRPPASPAPSRTESGFLATVLFPIDIAFDQAPTLQLAGPDALSLQLAWRRCFPNGCFADAPVSQDMLARLRAATTEMRISFETAERKKSNLSLSLRGLPQALDALSKQANVE